MAISRHGINRGDSGPLLSASFEETVEVLFKSAIFARKDDVDGVTPNIMLGQLAHVGTGVSDLLLDSAQLEHAVELEAPDQQQNASLREWGDASPEAVPGQAPAMTPYASSPAGLYGASPARGGATPGWGDAAFSPTVRWHIFRPIAGARRVAHLRGVAGVRRRGVAGVWRWGCESAYSLLVRSSVAPPDSSDWSFLPHSHPPIARLALRQPPAPQKGYLFYGEGPRSSSSLAHWSFLQLFTAALAESSSSGRFPDCSFPGGPTSRRVRGTRRLTQSARRDSFARALGSRRRAFDFA